MFMQQPDDVRSRGCTLWAALFEFWSDGMFIFKHTLSYLRNVTHRAVGVTPT